MFFLPRISAGLRFSDSCLLCFLHLLLYLLIYFCFCFSEIGFPYVDLAGLGLTVISCFSFPSARVIGMRHHSQLSKHLDAWRPLYLARSGLSVKEDDFLGILARLPALLLRGRSP